MIKQKWLLVFTIFALIAVAVSVQALGTSSAYHSTNPMTLKPGETRQAVIGLTNTAGEPQNVTMVAEITKGSDIAKLTEPEKQYFVPFGSSNDIGVTYTVTAPLIDPAGKSYNIEITITTVTPGTGGGVILGQSIVTVIPVIIASPTGEVSQKKGISTEMIVLIGLIVIVIAAIIIVILSMRKKNKKK